MALELDSFTWTISPILELSFLFLFIINIGVCHMPRGDLLLHFLYQPNLFGSISNPSTPLGPNSLHNCSSAFYSNFYLHPFIAKARMQSHLHTTGIMYHWGVILYPWDMMDLCLWKEFSKCNELPRISKRPWKLTLLSPPRCRHSKLVGKIVKLLGIMKMSTA